jgi:hypothetical protein
VHTFVTACQDAHLDPQVVIPALTGRVDDRIVECFVALLNFAYLARRNVHDTATIRKMGHALDRFHDARVFFEEAGIRDDGNGFNLPRQHGLVHYTWGIHMFGSPNGLDSSITENKHIEAVKEPYRRSNRNNPIDFILTANTRKQKLSAARAEFGRKGMLDRSPMEDAGLIAKAREDGVYDEDLDNAVYAQDIRQEDEDEQNPEDERDGHLDVNAVNGPWFAGTRVQLTKKYGTCT